MVTAVTTTTTIPGTTIEKIDSEKKINGSIVIGRRNFRNFSEGFSDWSGQFFFI